MFNLYAYEIETRKLFQVTNVVGGAFHAVAVSGREDAGLFLIQPKGVRHPYAQYRPRFLEAGGTLSRSLSDSHVRGKPVEISTRPYSPLSTIYPRFWLPWFGYSQESGALFGAFTFGQDVVQRHLYYLSALYGPKNNRTWYSLDYFYDGLYPTVRLQASDIDVTHSDLPVDASGVKDYVERQKTFGTSVIIPLVRSCVTALLHAWIPLAGDFASERSFRIRPSSTPC